MNSLNALWLDLTDRRNETAHTYDEKTAEKGYAVLPEAIARFRMIL